MENTRRVRVKVEYDGMDISESISQDLIRVSFTGYVDKPDEISISVVDREKLWRGSYYPKIAARSGG
jgi:hypothetical protein